MRMVFLQNFPVRGLKSNVETRLVSHVICWDNSPFAVPCISECDLY